MTPKRKLNNKVYIDREIVVHEGHDADLLIEQQAPEIMNISNSNGILRVNKKRWEEAQYYEWKTWLSKGMKNAFSAENDVYKNYFDDYQIMKGKTFKHGIELGCGPFTNLRLIVQQCQVKQIDLLDPLINEYLSHPLCQYKNYRLGGVFNVKQNSYLNYLRQPLTLFPELYSRYLTGKWRGQPVKTVNSMIENYQTNKKYDLVVMINVIEHCQDAASVFKKIYSLLAPHGMLVFHERLFDARAIKTLTSQLYDAGHPIIISREYVKNYLSKNYSKVYQKENKISREFHSVKWNENEFSFIGIKR